MNPRVLVPVLALVTAGSSGAAVFLFRQNAELRSRLALRSVGVVETPAVASAVAEPGDTSGAAAVTAPQQNLPSAGAVAVTEIAPPTPPAPGRPSPRFDRRERNAEAMARMLTDPEMRAAMLTRMKSRVDRQFGALFAKLGLNEVQAETLRTLLAERQMARLEGGMLERSGEDDASRDQAAAWRDSKLGSIEDGIASILGPNGAQILRDYQASMPQRDFVDDINRRAGLAGAPLALNESEKLVEVLRAVEQQIPAPAPDAGLRGGGAATPAPLTQQAVDRFVAQQEAQNREVLARAKGFLSQPQLDALADRQLTDLEATRAQLNFQLRNPDLPAGMMGAFGGPGGGGGGGWRGPRGGGG